MNNDNATTPLRNGIPETDLYDAWLLQTCKGQDGRIYHLVKRCLQSQRKIDLGEITEQALFRPAPVVDRMMLEEPLCVFYRCGGFKHLAIAAKIRNQYYVGKGIENAAGLMHWYPFVVEFEKEDYKFLADTPHTDPERIPHTEEDQEAAISIMLNPLDQYFLAKPDYSREVN